ncbi:MAG: hypothetical protein WC815_16900 [Vicinamibacterales bacterium]|jgi:hypothetical protein
MSVRIRFAGLTFLHLSTTGVEKGYAAGEVALIDPSAADAHRDLVKDVGSHLPLLVVKESSVKEVEGPDQRFPLEGAIRANWLGGATSVAGFVGWSLSGATVSLANDISKKLTVIRGTPNRDSVKGCNLDKTDWKSIEWIPSANVAAPGLELAPYWRTSPHIAARFVLGEGTLSSTTPLEPNSGQIPISLFPGDGPKAYSDALLFEKTVVFEPAITIHRPASRTMIRFDTTDLDVWVLSLDDPNHSTPSFDHFVLYSLLPWRFRVPEFDPKNACLDYKQTSGECFGMRYED